MNSRRRRIILASLGVTGALVIGWSVLPPRQRMTPSKPLPLGPGQVAFNGWVKISADNQVLVMMPKSEMGQGVHTGLAMLLAEELDADWAQVSIEHSPIDGIYRNIAVATDGLAFHPDQQGMVRDGVRRMTAKTVREIGLMMTGGSSSIKDLWLPMREAGASARAMLVAAAAQRWQVPAAQCRVESGRVLHESGNSASFGELASDAARQTLPAKVKLKEPAAFLLIGKPLRRIEASSKQDGSARFGIDVVLPGMVYASVLMCPTLGGRVASFDGSAAAKLTGVRKVLSFRGPGGSSGGVAVIADTMFHAMRAVREVKVAWDHGPAAGLSSADVMRRLAGALDRKDGFIYFERGDVDAAFASVARTISADYSAPYLAHATMEPINCTVQVRDGAATVWASTQVPDVARGVVARVLGLADERVDMQVQLIGGGFGRRLDVDYVAQAAEIAKAVPGIPVQTIWSREQDIAHDFYRPACVSRFRAGLDPAGRTVAWSNVSAGQSILPNVMSRYRDSGALLPLLAKSQAALAEALHPWLKLPGVGPDKTTSDGAFDQPYEWPHARVAHYKVDLPVPIGFWRSVGHSHQAFFKESFVDECAAATGADPVAYRAALLQRHPRHLAVLRRVAELSLWGQPLAAAPDGAPQARGVALHQSFGSTVAQVAEVSLAADKTIRVHRVFCVVDCGFAVNPNLIAQQMESGIVFGLSAALYGQIDIVNGQVQQSNFHNHPVLRLADCPRIVTDIMPSKEHPEGVGEPGVPPIAPAVANALFALTGQRLRALPLKIA